MDLAARSSAVRLRRIVWVVASAVAIAGCGHETGTSTEKHANAASSLPPAFALAAEPAAAKPVKDAVANAKSGEELVVVGRVGEAGAERAFFTLVDLGVVTCKERPGDTCPTPWDYCCEPAEELAKSSATIEFRNGAKPYAGSILGFHGLDHLSTVVVKGKAEKDSSGNLTIVADGVWVKPKS
jgi:hypothetical protein